MYVLCLVRSRCADVWFEVPVSIENRDVHLRESAQYIDLRYPFVCTGNEKINETRLRQAAIKSPKCLSSTKRPLGQGLVQTLEVLGHGLVKLSSA
jgi:hypothetical protein